MISFAKLFNLTGAALAALSLSAHATEAPKHVDVKQLSKKVEDVVVPLPNEVFGALNRTFVTPALVQPASPGQRLASPLDQRLPITLVSTPSTGFCSTNGTCFSAAA